MSTEQSKQSIKQMKKTKQLQQSQRSHLTHQVFNIPEWTCKMYMSRDVCVTWWVDLTHPSSYLRVGIYC